MRSAWPITVLGIRTISVTAYPRIFFLFLKQFRREPINALVSIPSGVHGVIFFAAWLAGIRARIVHVGGYPWHWKSTFWKYRLLMRLSSPVTSKAVCVTSHVCVGVAEHFGKVAKAVHIVANGIDLDRFARGRGEETSRQ